MANQSPDRRRVLELMAKAAVASQFPGFQRWAFAGQHMHSANTPVATKVANYTPQFFNPAEYRTIEVLTELILPADETPGAKQAGVSEFIDFMAAHGERDLQAAHDGLRWLDRTAKGSFTSLPPEEQEALLKKVAYKNGSGGDAEGRAFFELIRRYTVMGYYTSLVGLEALDYPGLKFYTHSPACPHTNDPEHLHLPPPRY